MKQFLTILSCVLLFSSATLAQTPTNAWTPLLTQDGRYFDKFIETLGGHGMGGMKIFQTQNLWDATMSWSVASYLKQHPKTKIMHIVGRFHTDEQLGTFAKFKKFAPKASAINVSSFSAQDFNNPNWEQYKHLGDYIIITDPSVKRSY